MISDAPNLATLDLEIARSNTGRGGGARSIAKGGISVVGVWGVRDWGPYVWLLDGSRFPRVFLSEDHMQKTMERYDGIVTFNGLNFDDVVMRLCVPDIQKTWRRKTHVDLQAVCCLLQAGVSPEKIVEAKEGWAKTVQTLSEDLLNAGWSLEAVAQGTLGIGKLEGPQGLESVHAWEDGRYSEVVSYNLWDVALTRSLYLHAWEHGWLESNERGRVSIPRICLGGE